MIKKRNAFVVVILTFITFGIYGIYWVAKTKGEMVEKGADIPTTWLVIVPFANIYYFWKYAAGVEQVSSGNSNGVLVFVLMWLIFPIGQIIVQMELNKLVAATA
jgi:hypothetical protein